METMKTIVLIMVVAVAAILLMDCLVWDCLCSWCMLHLHRASLFAVHRSPSLSGETIDTWNLFG